MKTVEFGGRYRREPGSIVEKVKFEGKGRNYKNLKYNIKCTLGSKNTMVAG